MATTTTEVDVQNLPPAVNVDPERERLLRRNHLHRVFSRGQERFRTLGLRLLGESLDLGRGHVIGLDRDTGALAITDWVRVGQTVQFHVRDAETADEDLHALLQIDMSAHEQAPAGALVFSCNGRGSRLFPAPHHDADALLGESDEDHQPRRRRDQPDV